MSTVDTKKFKNAQTKTAGPSGVGMIIRQREPVNFEFPFDKLDSFLTPNDLFYIRSHFKSTGTDCRFLSAAYPWSRREPAESELSTAKRVSF
jgi:hypothetical protein